MHKSVQHWVQNSVGRSKAGSWRALLRAIASLRFTLVALSMLALAVLWILWHSNQATTVLVLPLGVLALNLAAAMLCHPRFRWQFPLLCFHLALLLAILLAMIGRLTYLKGHTELSVGAQFEGGLTAYTAGPLHRWSLSDVQFVNHGFEINYDAGPRRRDTFNRVSWKSEKGEVRQLVIGDQYPLVLDGYRFYTSFNKGFAPLFTWRSHSSGAPVTGDLHLPSYPEHANRQTAEWQPPDSDRKIWFMLKFDETILATEQASLFRPPASHRLLLRVDGERFELGPGAHVLLPEGRLDYHGLGTWMGYTVFYDWTRPWLLATSLLAVLSLGLHFYFKFTRQSWLQERS